jgi:hypothetical protein
MVEAVMPVLGVNAETAVVDTPITEGGTGVQTTAEGADAMGGEMNR